MPGDPQRIVVLSGGLAGYLFALDAPVVATDTRVLGVTDLDGGFPPSWAAEAKEQGTAALPAGEQLNVEAVAAAQPDLIIGGGQGITAVQAADSYDALSAIAPTVLVPTTTTAWQEQLDLVAEAAGRADGVQELTRTYEEEVAQVRRDVDLPQGAAVFLLSLPNGKPYLVPADAALPRLTAEVGLTPDDVVTEAGNPPLYGSGDSFEVSPELLASVADAPNAFVVDLGGRGLQELKADPLYAALPSFAAGNVWELPATSYRPDYDGALGALDALERLFAA
ncbi:ABC transporter substrate-binding protein [Kineococcus vitellinus]|uniref:ABC transporter substrate-binding protein n=1 Tax=Kineococcus vitellinus TaxID=2696565 RepID=UPI00196BA0A0